MKILLIILFLSVLLFSLSGCADYITGFGSGVAAMETIGNDAQNKFIVAVNALNAETARLNGTVDEIDGTILIRPETLNAVKGLKGRTKDPVTWIALTSMLANAFWGGQTFIKRNPK